MRKTLAAIALGTAALTLAGCANSVLNDPAEMARRRAEVERNQAAWDRFWGSGVAVGGGVSSGGGGSSGGGFPDYDAQRRAAAASCVNSGGSMIGGTCTGRY